MKASSSIDKTHLNGQYYTKRLNTELFRAPTLKDQFTGLTHKIEHQIEIVKRNMRTKNSKMFKAKERRRTIENEQERMRTTLRSKIQQKIRLSQTNLEKLILSKNSQSKSKEKFRQTTLSRIKSMQKTFIDQSFKKSQEHSKNTERFLNQKSSEKSISKITNYSRNSQFRVTREPQTKYSSFYIDDSRQRVLPKILKVSDSDIKTRQSRKVNLEQMKEVKNLSTYVEKLHQIDAKRKFREGKISQTVKLLEKAREAERKKYESRKMNQSSVEKPSKKFETSQVTRGAIRNRVSFSEIYSKKLEQTLTKKSFLTELSMREGNKIIADSSKDKRQKRNSYLLKETLKQMQLKANFRYMQRLKKQ